MQEFALFIGMSPDDVISVKENGSGTIDAESLRREVKMQKGRGNIIMMIAATLGGVGHLEAEYLKKIFRDRASNGKIWIHMFVDAKCRGVFNPKNKPIEAVIRDTNSITIDLQSLIGMPYGLGVALFQNQNVLRHYLKQSAPYVIRDGESDEMLNLSGYSPEGSKGFQALELFLTFLMYGKELKKAMYEDSIGALDSRIFGAGNNGSVKNRLQTGNQVFHNLLRKPLDFSEQGLSHRENLALIAAPDNVVGFFENWWWHRAFSTYEELYRTNVFENIWISFFKSISYMNPKAKILDIGTGPFALPRLAQQYGFKSFNFVAVDPAEPYINPERLGIEFHKIKAEDIQFEKDSFDAVISCYGIEYSEIEATLQKIYAVLKPGGKVIFIIHHPESKIMNNMRLYNSDNIGQWIISRAEQISADPEKLKSLLINSNHRFNFEVLYKLYCRLEYNIKELVGWYVELSKPNISVQILHHENLEESL